MKKSKDMFRGILIGIVLTVMVVSIPAVAASATKRSIDVVYNDIKLVVDGKQVTPLDGSGNVVEPFIYNGTTYLPLRAVANALTGGTKPVSWDQSTYTAYIGERPVQEIVDMVTMKSYPGNAVAFKANQTFEVRQKTYTPFNLLTSNGGTFLLGGDYITLNGFAAVSDGYNSGGFITFTNADTKEELLKVEVIHGEEPVSVSLDVTGIDKLSISRSSGTRFFNATLTPITTG